MIATKKKLSVNLVKSIELAVKDYKKIIRIKANPDFLLYFVDSDPHSTFYFGINKETSDSSGHYIHFAYSPQSPTNKEAITTTYKLDTFIGQLKLWLTNIEYYNQESILDDPILNGYEKEFLNEFSVVDDDADSSAFNYEQQLLLDAYLEQIKSEIRDYSNDNNASLIEEIISEASILQDNITSETKNSVMKSMSRLFAKGRKAGLKVSNYLMKEFIKEMLSNGAKWAFNFAVSNAHELPSYIQQITKKLLTN